MRGADLLVRTLANAGTKVIFTLSGNQIMPIFDACIDHGIELVHTRHEAAAVFMADAYAQLTGKAGIALVTAAPGFANSVGALFTARQSESPVVLLSGDSPLSQDGKGAFQELDQVSVSAPMTKLSFRPAQAQELGRDVARALQVALSGRPGPVHCALPFDLLNEDVGNAAAPPPEDCEPAVTRPTQEAVSGILDALAAASRPLVLTGPSFNASRAAGLLSELTNAVDAPAISLESPRGLKDPSLGNITAVLAQADVIVSLGKKLDFTTGFASPPTVSDDCKLLVVDPEPDALESARRAAGARLALACEADIGTTIRALIEKGNGTEARSAYRKEVAAALAEKPAAKGDAGKAPVHPAHLCASVQQLLDKTDDPVLIIDGGEFGQWAQACLSAKTRIINGPSGAIGGCLCYALGAKAARPGATVVVLMGDGTAGFHFAEFETAHRHSYNFLAVIGNDARWNAEYQIQLRDYGENRTYACELNPTRYDEAVAGLGGHGEHVNTADELDAALERALASGVPSCVNVTIEGAPAPAGPSH